MKRFLILLSLFVLIFVGGMAYSKSHTIRTCKVIQEHDKVITVLHPNGEVYDFYAYNSNEFKEDTIIKVSFNELKLDKQDYEVNAANPKEVLVDIKDRGDE